MPMPMPVAVAVAVDLVLLDASFRAQVPHRHVEGSVSATSLRELATRRVAFWKVVHKLHSL
jgi:hypothetical protein